MRELHLFAGIGGGILAGELLGHRCVGAVEIDPYCRRVLEARQRDGSLPAFPIHDDIRTFDGTAWRGRVDVVCGGFPCQPWSAAGKRLGAADERHLWPEMARVVAEVRPALVFAENVSLAAFEEPWRDLRRLGYRVPPALCLAAADVGACHRRERWWLLAADADGAGWHGLHEWKQPRHLATDARVMGEGDASGEAAPDTDCLRQRQPEGLEPDERGRPGDGGEEPPADAIGEPLRAGELGRPARPSRAMQGEGEERQRLRHDAGESRPAVSDACRPRLEEWLRCNREREGTFAGGARWWPTAPALCGADDVVPRRVDRLRGLGNAQVPLQAATAFRELWRRLA